MLSRGSDRLLGILLLTQYRVVEPAHVVVSSLSADPFWTQRSCQDGYQLTMGLHQAHDLLNTSELSGQEEHAVEAATAGLRIPLVL